MIFPYPQLLFPRKGMWVWIIAHARALLLIWCALILVLVMLGQVVVINASRSAPYAGFWAIPTYAYRLVGMEYTPARGDWIKFTPPVESEWDYVKQVIGVAGDSVSVVARDSGGWQVSINDDVHMLAVAHTPSGRAMHPIDAGVIPEGYYFVAAPSPLSRDSRYAEIGLIPHAHITARVLPFAEAAQ